MSAVPCTDFLRDLEKQQEVPVYYFFGEEPYLIEQALAQWTHRVVGRANDFNTSKFNGEDDPPERVLLSLRTLPFGAAKRLVIVRRAEAYGAQDLEQFLPYLSDPSEFASLVFWGGEKIDLRLRFFKELGKRGLLVESSSLRSEEVLHWLQSEARKKGHELDSRAAGVIELLVGNSLHALSQSLERLSLFVGEGQKITAEAIREILADTHEGILWDLTDGLGTRDLARCLRALKRVLRNREFSSPVMILGAIAGFYRRLLWVRLAESLGLGDAELRQAAGLSPGALYFSRRLAKRFSHAELERNLGLVFQTDRKLKSVGLPPALLLEQLVMEIVRPARTQNAKSSNS